MNKKETIIVRVTPVIKKELELIALESRRSLSDFLRITFEDVIQAKKQFNNIQKPPYKCPLSIYGEKEKCKYPKCTCEWDLNK